MLLSGPPSLRHKLARYQIPNEQVQQEPQLLTELGQPAPSPGTPPQLQTADSFETMGIASYQHLFSPDFLVDVRNMSRANHNDFYSNPWSWPIIVLQHHDFREEYFSASASVHHGFHEWKAGVETDNMFLHENYSDIITASPAYPGYSLDPGTTTTYAFIGSRPDIEQAAFAQNLIHLANWTVDADPRWDHYQLLLNQNAVSPRFSASLFLHRRT